jgi:protoporphyrinogen oxidase
MSKKTAIIIGAGPAGLTAAYELLTRTDIKPIVLERDTYMGGISRTVNYKGNRIDIGGHRFFSKSDRVMEWWYQHMPIEAQTSTNSSGQITYHNMSRSIPTPQQRAATKSPDEVLLLRSRKSRIYFLRKFFDYPITLSKNTLANLGLVRTIKIGISYLKAATFPVAKPKNLEQFFINRFGRELYLTFFKSYTEKVWGVACHEISAEWGEQRIKGLSIKKTLLHILKKQFQSKKDVAQKNLETSLIEQFLYPKFGPGQMWETVARKVKEMGGEIHTGINITGIQCDGASVKSITGRGPDGTERTFVGDYFFSTMAMKDLVRAMDASIPANVKEVSEGLMYRDFITVGLLCKQLKISEKGKKLVEDNWIYIQEPDVLAGRLQIFNNWSPYMLANPEQVWIGVEYFCYEVDELWKKPETEMKEFAAMELAKIGIIDQADVLDATVIHMPKTYPAYFGSYDRFEELRGYLDGFTNLFLVGRNGMHRYNNQDHSMLTAMLAVDNIMKGVTDKANLWEVNTEMEYHEERSAKEAQAATAK